MIRAILATVLILGWALSGCALLRPTPPPPPAVGAIINAHDGRVVSREHLARRLSRAQVVVVGESHNHPGHHQVQLDALKMMERPAAPLVVAVEWLEHSAQGACDQFASGQLTLQQFAKKVDWQERWGYPLKLYAAILQRVQDHKHRLVAANAPLPVIRKLAHNGLEDLTPAERNQLAPSLDLTPGPYRNRLLAASRAHGLSEQSRREYFVVAQIARDETMAHHLAAQLLPWPDNPRRALLFTGGGHLAHGAGVVPRIRRRLPGVDLVTVMPVSQGSVRAAGPPAQGPPAADYLIITAAAPPRPPRLGIIIKPQPPGIKIIRVLPDSTAHKAGMRADDLIVAIDGKKVASPRDIHAIIIKAPFASHRYTLQRGGKQVDITITIDRPRRKGR